MESKLFDSLSYRERNSVFRVASRNFEKMPCHISRFKENASSALMRISVRDWFNLQRHCHGQRKR